MCSVVIQVQWHCRARIPIWLEVAESKSLLYFSTCSVEKLSAIVIHLVLDVLVEYYLTLVKEFQPTSMNWSQPWRKINSDCKRYWSLIGIRITPTESKMFWNWWTKVCNDVDHLPVVPSIISRRSARLQTETARHARYNETSSVRHAWKSRCGGYVYVH